MFDIGGLELLLIAIVSLLILGPERLPETLRTLGLWLGRLRRSFTSVKAEIEKEIGMDEVRRQLHNEAVMEEMKRIEREVQASVDDAKIDPNLVSGEAGAPPTSSAENDSGNATLETAPDAATESAEPGADATTVRPDAASEPPPYEPPKPRPRSEAEVEAAYERKMRARQAEAKAAKDN